MWLRGATGEQGPPTLNYPSVGMFPWMQQRLDPSLLGNDHHQQYQAMLAASMQSVDPMRQQFMQLQQSAQYLQQAGSHNPLLQLKQQQQHQAFQQSNPNNLLQVQSQILTENVPQHLLQQLNNQPEEQAHQQQQQLEQQQQHMYHDALQIQGDQLLHRQQSKVPSLSFSKTNFMDSNTEISGPMTPMQNMLGSLTEGSGNLLNFSGTSQSMLREQVPQQPSASKYAHSPVHTFVNSMSLPLSYNGKNTVGEPENSNPDAQNSTIFGVHIDSSGLVLPTTVSTFATSVDPDVSSTPLGDSGFHNSLYGCMQDSSELLHSAGQIDQPTLDRTFVKVSWDLWYFSLPVTCVTVLANDIKSMFGRFINQGQLGVH